MNDCSTQRNLSNSGKDQSKTIDIALKYAGSIKSGMERMRLKAEQEISFLEEGMPSRKMISDAVEE